MSRRRSREHLTQAESRSGYYASWTHQADKILAKNDAEVRPDNWQQLALDWFTPHEPERRALARYIAAHQAKLGVAWAWDVLRKEIFFQVGAMVNAQPTLQLKTRWFPTKVSGERSLLMEIEFAVNARGDKAEPSIAEIAWATGDVQQAPADLPPIVPARVRR
jgi:hypothetical protein